MAEMTSYQTPHLATTLTGPLQLLEKNILNHQTEIEIWFEQQWRSTQAPAYGSVDLRNSGFKLAPVDMNLFPAGFNNIRTTPAFVALSVAAAKHIIHQVNPQITKVLIVPESHTRNKFYWENLQSIFEVLVAGGFAVRIGSLSTEITTVQEIKLENDSLSVEPLQRKENILFVENFIPDLLLLNNDLSDGIPEILQNLTQPLIPPAELGWSQRLKSQHFQCYDEVAKAFAELIHIDPWLINPIFTECGDVDFMRREGEELLASHVKNVLDSIRLKYAEYNIKDDPYVVIKANAGTYGMAIMMVKSVDEVMSLNRKQRTHMSKSKGGQSVNSVIVQEGVYTFETWGPDNAVAEPVVYMWGERVVGGFYRVHKDRGIDENLNAPGMHFEPLAFVKSCQQPKTAADSCANRFYGYGVVARLSMLAAAREIQACKK